MKELLDRLVDAYVQYLRAIFNPYLILLSVILVVLICLVLWLIKKL